MSVANPIHPGESPASTVGTGSAPKASGSGGIRYGLTDSDKAKMAEAEALAILHVSELEETSQARQATSRDLPELVSRCHPTTRRGIVGRVVRDEQLVSGVAKLLTAEVTLAHVEAASRASFGTDSHKATVREALLEAGQAYGGTEKDKVSEAKKNGKVATLADLYATSATVGKVYCLRALTGSVSEPRPGQFVVSLKRYDANGGVVETIPGNRGPVIAKIQGLLAEAKNDKHFRELLRNAGYLPPKKEQSTVPMSADDIAARQFGNPLAERLAAIVASIPADKAEALLAKLEALATESAEPSQAPASS